jgi:hypothetical protein
VEQEMAAAAAVAAATGRQRRRRVVSWRSCKAQAVEVALICTQVLYISVWCECSSRCACQQAVDCMWAAVGTRASIP